jgi:signal transduction histidine kinase
MKMMLRKNKIEALVPIPIKENVYGMILLGKKKSDDAYLLEDEALLQTLMDEVSMFFMAEKLLKEAADSSLELAQRVRMAAMVQLARGVHHEIRNPLYVISLFASSSIYKAEEKIWRTFPKEAFVKEIARRVDGLLGDIERIQASLDRFAQFARPQEDVLLTSLSVKEELEKFLSLMRVAWKLDQIEIHQSVPEDIRVLATAGGLQDIFFNLYLNAYEAMQGAGRLEISAQGNGTYAEFRIRDSGPGISEEILPHIFDEYFTTKTNSESVGIGLSIVKNRIESFGGSIGVNSKKGTGAEFILKLRKANGVQSLP